MLIAQLSDLHIKLPGRLAYKKVDTATMLAEAVRHLNNLAPAPDLVLITGDLADIGTPEEYAWIRQLLAPLKAPMLVIPGNHDERDAMRIAFADGGYLPKTGFLNFAIEREGLRLIGLDTLVPGQGSGAMCTERLAWLDTALSGTPEMPTLLMMHHPPFLTGIGHMDRIGLQGREEFANILTRHPQVISVLCGHLHRTIHTTVGGRPAMTCPSPAHQVFLDLRDEAPSQFCMEPPGFMLHTWQAHPRGGVFTSHTGVIGKFAGPFPFFDAYGKLID